MTSPTRTTLRRAAGALLLLALATGCGIRPTAVPVDAGAPASRTACPTAPHIPTALPTPPVPAAPAVTPARGAARPSAAPSPTPSPVGPGSPPPNNAFSALPTASPSCR
ncbi:hypothetical protein AB0O91_29165 [Kitasatospora sp. NPDC089797]|uniref:hypothetical protein n=1 Tax=Kitasatospora sp. NPDC089797 TaxID=3155298 RepID=UPI00343D4372